MTRKEQIFNVMVKDINKAFDLRESLRKNEKLEVEIVEEERSSGTWYNVCYTRKNN